MSTKTKYNLQLPRMGESVDEATIVSWLKEVGDEINVDDFVIEIATDKYCKGFLCAHVANFFN